MHIRWIFFYFFLCSFFLFLLFGKHVSQYVEVPMKRATFRCACCRRILPRNSKVKNQRYCGDKACQRARKRKWQREKLETDPDHRANKRASQQAWKNKNPTYWKEYRRKNSASNERNRQLQRVRDRAKCRGAARDDLAKTDTSMPFFNDTSAIYYISTDMGNLAKMDALPVKIIQITAG